MVSSKREERYKAMAHYFITIQEYETLKVYENDHVYKAIEIALVKQLGRTIGEAILHRFMNKTIQEMTVTSGVDIMSAITIK